MGYGCRVIQRLCENCTATQLQELIAKVLEKADKLSRDKHGNYVVQCILKHGKKEDVQEIIKIIQTDLVDFAKNKVSSNVVEKCFEVLTEGDHAELLTKEREQLFAAFLGNAEDAKSPLNVLM